MDCMRRITPPAVIYPWHTSLGHHNLATTAKLRGGQVSISPPNTLWGYHGEWMSCSAECKWVLDVRIGPSPEGNKIQGHEKITFQQQSIFKGFCLTDPSYE